MKRKIFIFYFCLFYNSNVFCGEYSSLIERSPFCVTREYLEVEDISKKKKCNFELRGICYLEDEYVFSIHNMDSGKAFLAKIGEIKNECSVKKYYPKTRTIELLSTDGEVCPIKLKTLAPRNYVIGEKNDIRVNMDKNIGQEVDEKTRQEFWRAMINNINCE